MPISPRRNHRQRIYDRFLDRILTGALTREDRLVDTVIAAELGVSRMPVRDALMQLVAEGYLASTSRGFTVPQLSDAEIAEVFELRHLLEPRAMAQCATAIGGAALDRLADHLALTRATLEDGDTVRFFQASEAFRNGWISGIPNAALREAIRRYAAQVQQVRLATVNDRGARAIMVAGQADQLAALRARDALAAHDIMRRFVVEGERSWARSLAQARAALS